MEECWVQRNF